MKPLLLFFLLLPAGLLFSQTFPALPCRDVNDTELIFVPSRNEKASLVFVQTKTNDSKVLESWIDPLIQKFVRRSGMLDGMFDADLWFLAFLKPAEAAVLKKSVKKMQEELPEEMKTRSVYTTESPDLLESITLNGGSSYIVVVASDGKILGTVQGEFTEDKMDTIQELLIQ
jgi:hypothetical protein